MNNKKLSIIFIVLLFIVVIYSIIDKSKGDRSFIANLVEVDTSEISRIEIEAVKDNKLVVLEKLSGEWKAKKEGDIYSADLQKINSLLEHLGKMKPSGVVTDEKDKWKEYDVTDSVGVRVKVFAKNKLKSDFIIGRFNAKKSNNPYNRNPDFSTYVRPYDDDKVYVINQLLIMSFTSDFDSYRNHIVVKVNPEDIKKINFSYPADSSFNLENNNGIWSVNGMIADSTEVVNYLRSYRNLTQYKFTDQKIMDNADYKITLEGNNMIEPIVISAVDINNMKIIHSSANKEAYFDGNSGDLFSRLFIGEQKLVKK